MSVDDLRHEQREYVLRIEEVLAGMDRVLTDLATRVVALERQMKCVHLPKADDSATAEHLRSLDEQIATMGMALSELMSERR